MLCAGLLGFPVLPLSAQDASTPPKTALVLALDLESANKCREAIPLYRQSVGGTDPVSAVLGLERCYAQVGGSEAILPLVDSMLTRKPTDPTLRTVQLRTLTSLRRAKEADSAFAQWLFAAPRDPAPYRIYARQLLESGRAAAADTVLRRAEAALGGTRDLAAEFAQMQAALGMWEASATSWREASETMDYMVQAAVFSLIATPDSLRDGVRAVFVAPPAALPSRRILAALETRWRSARQGWAVLSQVTPTDSAVDAWIDFAGDAASNESWLTARDAYAAAAVRRPQDHTLRVKAATAALSGGEPASALTLLQPLATSGDSTAAGAVALLEVRALAALGRAPEIERLLAERAGPLGEQGVKQAQRTLAWAWIRSGDLAKARAALIAGGGGTEEDSRVEAWLALYEGDLKTARAGLRRTDETSRDVVTAMALLSRTRADTSPSVGHAFLVLAKGDTAQAAHAFELTADSLPNAAPFLLLVAARLSQASGDTPHAVQLWRRVIDDYSTAPEAAESELDWARVLRAQGNAVAAIEHLEHLILTYTQSSLVPQARRELELARGTVPPGRG
ncbi:MAG: hypothetical protein ABI910_17915 [Gemmatimonadota bacterium]